MRTRLLICVLLLSINAIGGTTARVKHVSDGDSFILASGERVRMIGINAPELKDQFGPQAKEHLTKLIAGKTVTLDGDRENDDRDVHGRLLRFVSLDGIDINRQMIVDGYAYAFLRYSFAREKRDAYREAEQTAKASGVGLWAADGTAPQTSPTSRDDTRPGSPEPFLSASNVLLALGILAVLVLFVMAFLRRRS